MTAGQRQHADCPNAVREDTLPCLAEPAQRVRGTYPQLDYLSSGRVLKNRHSSIIANRNAMAMRYSTAFVAWIWLNSIFGLLTRETSHHHATSVDLYSGCSDRTGIRVTIQRNVKIANVTMAIVTTNSDQRGT